MIVVSVNIGTPRSMRLGSTECATGIWKASVAEPVIVTADGLDGDTIVDQRNHGGPDQAVYLYGTADYAWWESELGRALPPGAFGENLTISDLESASLCAGDLVQIGETILEVTAPRIPCAKLDVRLEEPGFAERFLSAERPGAHCRVRHAGTVQAGMKAVGTPGPEPRVSLAELMRTRAVADVDTATLLRHLAAPISARERERRQRELDRRSA